MDEKKCTKCGETKPLDGFARRKDSRDGHCHQCKECTRPSPEKRREYQRRFIERHPGYWSKYDAKRDRRKDWRERHRKHPHRQWVTNYRHRARTFGVDPVVGDFTKPDVIARYGDSCFYCETGAFEHLDHAIPVSKGGPHTLDNVRPSCAACNIAKADMTETEWLAEQAALDNLTPDELGDHIDAEIERWS